MIWVVLEHRDHGPRIITVDMTETSAVLWAVAQARRHPGWSYRGYYTRAPLVLTQDEWDNT